MLDASSIAGNQAMLGSITGYHNCATAAVALLEWSLAWV